MYSTLNRGLGQRRRYRTRRRWSWKRSRTYDTPLERCSNGVSSPESGRPPPATCANRISSGAEASPRSPPRPQSPTRPTVPPSHSRRSGYGAPLVVIIPAAAHLFLPVHHVAPGSTRPGRVLDTPSRGCLSFRNRGSCIQNTITPYVGNDSPKRLGCPILVSAPFGSWLAARPGQRMRRTDHGAILYQRSRC